MAQALYRKWRSQTFEEVVGQEHVTQTLRNALRDGRVAHAYLFSGPRGTGKTSTARILAKALNCGAPAGERPCNQCPTCLAINEGRMLDLIEIDAASNNSVDDVRELRDKVGFSPSEGRYKIYIIDEVHMLSTSAFNALLKTLEEPPPHARFVLATTEPHKIPATVLSRCQRFDFRRIPVPEIAAHLRHIATVEGFGADDEALVAIARSAQGCMRDAVSLLDQMLSFGADVVSLAQVQNVLGSVSAEAVAALVDAVTQADVSRGLLLIQDLVVQGASLTEFCQQVIEYLRGVMLIQMTEETALLVELPVETIGQMREQAARIGQPHTLHAIKCFSAALPELKGGYQPQLPLEMALIEAIRGPVALAAAPQVPAAQPVAPIAVAAHAPTPPVAAATPSGAGARPPVSSHAGDVPAAAPTPGAVEAHAPPVMPQPGDSAVSEAPLDEAAVHKLTTEWKNFLAVVRTECGHREQAALNTVRDMAVTSNTVALAFGNNQFTRDMIAKPETNAIIADLLSRFLGRAVALDCQMGEQAHVLNPIGTQSTTVDDDGPDSLLDYAVENLRAKVVK